MKNCKIWAFGGMKKAMDVFINTLTGKIYCQIDVGENSGLEEMPKDTRVLKPTNINDKNGNEIYEEDIIFIKDKDEDTFWWGVVRDIAVNGGWAVVDKDEIVEIWDDKTIFEIEIIGNTFENKELLKEYNLE